MSSWFITRKIYYNVFQHDESKEYVLADRDMIKEKEAGYARRKYTPMAYVGQNNPGHQSDWSNVQKKSL